MTNQELARNMKDVKDKKKKKSPNGRNKSWMRKATERKQKKRETKSKQKENDQQILASRVEGPLEKMNNTDRLTKWQISWWSHNWIMHCYFAPSSANIFWGRVAWFTTSNTSVTVNLSIWSLSDYPSWCTKTMSSCVDPHYSTRLSALHHCTPQDASPKGQLLGWRVPEAHQLMLLNWINPVMKSLRPTHVVHAKN